MIYVLKVYFWDTGDFLQIEVGSKHTVNDVKKQVIKEYFNNKKEEW